MTDTVESGDFIEKADDVHHLLDRPSVNLDHSMPVTSVEEKGERKGGGMIMYGGGGKSFTTFSEFLSLHFCNKRYRTISSRCSFQTCTVQCDYIAYLSHLGWSIIVHFSDSKRNFKIVISSDNRMVI